MTTSKSRASSAGLALGDLDAEPRVGVAQGAERVRDEGERGGLERGDPQHPRDAAQGRGEVGLRAFEAFQDGLGVRDEDLGLRGQPDPAPHGFQQRDPGLLLQDRQLLRDRRRAVGEGLGHGGERPAVLQLAQQPEPVEVQHRHPRSFG